ncbi:hypothetical protein B0A48_06774 [Cryoendolithus antarcticus]|uniref:Uncharacterized protein n=1 Tax=Cryoendolithus antarcticus TaxID=1507870 RepID=A0A1V8T9P8_9PEZI|nr:hypothetical protein B0A48_06774 [Cryoendolithus antarcticus]
MTTSHTMTVEAKPLLFARALTFPSQHKLSSWTAQHSQTDLNRVRDLTLRLSDIDLTPLLEGNPRGGVWSLYAAHLAELQSSLRHLPNLKKLTVVPPRNTHSTLLRGFYLTLLSMIPKLWPRLKLLVIHDDEATLKAVPSLSQVAKVDLIPTLKSGADARNGRSLRQSSKERKVGRARVDSAVAQSDSSDAEQEAERMMC